MQTRVLRRHKLLALESHESVQLDDELVCILMEIERLYLDFPKPIQIRIERWVEKISEPIVHVPWKKNANYYAILLLEMIRRGVFREPFDKNPPAGPLQTLPRYMINALEGTKKPTKNNTWLKAYERVVGRTLEKTSKPRLSRERDDGDDDGVPPSPWTSPATPSIERDVRRPPSYVEMANETLNRMESDLEKERATTASLRQQLQEMSVHAKTQAVALDAAKQDLQSSKTMHHREVERMQMLHAVEVDELKKKHHRQIQEAILQNERTMAQTRANATAERMLPLGAYAMIVPPDDSMGSAGESSIQDFLAYIDRFQVETCALTRKSNDPMPARRSSDALLGG
ncbi:Aste57867_21297 [Aphanomyces stellatus]|uniref:Aste57867_21297 protein n=1 Tax=Aphanomyces stellatus TaxID=120398 RepID=A0A485LHR7_9STRA|nr:hypothetical protein As57867_021228 [Aphanomyces stellatus]VFT97969.1 Aste57867_21297 [Aphanomyces stellatus]